MHTSLPTLTLLSIFPIPIITALHLPRGAGVAPLDSSAQPKPSNPPPTNLKITDFGARYNTTTVSGMQFTPSFSFFINDPSSTVPNATCHFPETNSADRVLPVDIGVPQPCDPPSYEYVVQKFDAESLDVRLAFAHTIADAKGKVSVRACGGLDNNLVGTYNITCEAKLEDAPTGWLGDAEAPK